MLLRLIIASYSGMVRMINRSVNFGKRNCSLFPLQGGHAGPPLRVALQVREIMMSSYWKSRLDMLAALCYNALR